MRTYVLHNLLTRRLMIFVCASEAADGSREFLTTIGGKPSVQVASGAEPPMYCQPIPVGDEGPIAL